MTTTTPEPITIFDVFEARRRAKGNPAKDAYSAQEFADLGLSMLGGCWCCEESLAAYNAHPDVNGLWACRGCLKEGYPSVEAFEEEQAQVSDELGELGGLGGDDDV